MKNNKENSPVKKTAPVTPPVHTVLNHIDDYFVRLEQKVMNYFDRLDRKVDKNLFYFACATSIFCAFVMVWLFVKG